MATKKKETIPVAASALFALFGKTVDDEAVQAVIAASGKVKVEKPGRDGAYVFAKEAGYALLLRPIPGAPRGAPQEVDEIFLHSDGQDGYRGFAFPFGIAAATVNTDLHAQLGPPLAKGFSSDLWKLDGFYVDVVYTQGDVAGVKVNGVYDTYRVLDLRVRAHELEWEQRRRQHDNTAVAAAVARQAKKPAAKR